MKEDRGGDRCLVGEMERVGEEGNEGSEEETFQTDRDEGRWVMTGRGRGGDGVFLHPLACSPLFYMWL